MYHKDTTNRSRMMRKDRATLISLFMKKKEIGRTKNQKKEAKGMASKWKETSSKEKSVFPISKNITFTWKGGVISRSSYSNN